MRASAQARPGAPSKPLLPLGLPPTMEQRFRERNFGARTCRRHAYLEHEQPDTCRAFWRAAASNQVAGGKCSVDLIERVRTGLATIEATDAVLVVHSGAVRAAMAIALDLAPERALSFVIAPWSLTRLDRVSDGWRVEYVNRDQR